MSNYETFLRKRFLTNDLCHSFPRDINCLDHSTSKLGSQFSSCKMTNCWLEPIILFTFHLAVFAL